MLYVQVISYGHIWTVSSPNHTFFLGMHDLAVNQYFVHTLSLVNDNNPSWISGREENGRRNYFMINLRERMGPDQDPTPTPGSPVRNVTNCNTRPGICCLDTGFLYLLHRRATKRQTNRNCLGQFREIPWNQTSDVHQITLNMWRWRYIMWRWRHRNHAIIITSAIAAIHKRL